MQAMAHSEGENKRQQCEAPPAAPVCDLLFHRKLDTIQLAWYNSNKSVPQHQKSAVLPLQTRTTLG